MACQKTLLSLLPHEAVPPRSMTLEDGSRDLETLCGAGCETQLLIRVDRVLVSPVSASAATW